MLKRHRLQRSYRNLLCKQELQHLLRKYSRSQMGELFVLDGKTIAVDLEETRQTGVRNIVTLNAWPSFLCRSISHSEEEEAQIRPKLNCYGDKKEV